MRSSRLAIDGDRDAEVKLGKDRELLLPLLEVMDSGEYKLMLLLLLFSMIALVRESDGEHGVVIEGFMVANIVNNCCYLRVLLCVSLLVFE